MRVENVRIYDLEESVKASKYPMATDVGNCTEEITNTVINLAKSECGAGHDQWLSGIRVAFDLTFSNKAWVEMERYHFVDFVSSQSTMHRITKFDIRRQCNRYVDSRLTDIVKEKINQYNWMLKLSENPDYDIPEEEIKNKKLEILYNIPSGFELTARLTTNYRQLKIIYMQRRNHALPDWQYFCDWVETLPHFMELCINEK